MNSSPINSATRRTGKAMLIISWLLILAGLTWFFAYKEEQRFNPNQSLATTSDGKIREVILASNPYNHYVATALINDQPVTVLLDTGATDVVIPGDLAAKLGLRRGISGYAQTANGRVKIYSTMLNSVQLGDITLHNISASINPAMDDQAVLLGMSALRQLEFTHSQGKLIIRQYSP